MFELRDLRHYSIEVDLSEFLPSETTPPETTTGILEKINLRTLKMQSFLNVTVGLKKLGELIPSIEFSKHFGKHRIEIKFFENRKLVFEILKSESMLVISTLPSEKEKEEVKELSKKELEDLGTDFNFLYGQILGILKIKENPEAEVLTLFRRKQKVLPSTKFQALNENVSTIFGKPKSAVNGIRFKILDDEEAEHEFHLWQSDENFNCRKSFKFKVDAPIALYGILESDMQKLNAICQKVFEA